MKVFLVIFLAHVNSAFKPPTIDVEEHQIQEHSSIGRFIELKENDNLVLKCAGRYDDLKFKFPNMEEHVGYSSENFNNRIEEYIDDSFGDTVLTISNVQESDTGTYSCTPLEHSSLNDTLHVFVAGANTFVQLKSVGFMYDEGEVIIPCKTTRFLDKSDIELYSKEHLIKSASKNFDPRYGFKLTKKMYDTKPIENVPFECRYKKDPSQEVDYLITEKESDSSDDDYKFYWEKEMDWPYVGHHYKMVCHLVYSGAPRNFHYFYNKLHVDCPQCSIVAGSRVFADINRRNGMQISLNVTINSLEAEDSGPYRCFWKQEGKEEKVIEEFINVAPKKAQIKIVERTEQFVRLKEGQPFTLSTLFAIYPMEGEQFQAKWSRMFNSSIKDDIQSETILNDEFRTISTSKVKDGSFSEKLEISGAAVIANMSGTYVLSISLLDTVQVVQWEVAIENAVPDVQIAIREPSSFIVFNQQFYPPDTHLHIDCVSVSIPPGEVVFEQRTDKNSEFSPIDSNQLTEVGGTFENGFIWNVTLADDIELRCSSKRNGKVITASKSIIVADEAPSAYSRIIKSEKATSTEDPKTLYEGDNVELTCIVPTGAADWTVFWRFDNIVYDSETEVRGHSKHVVLKLKDVTTRSSGRYTCVVKNGESEKHLEKHIVVERISRPHHTAESGSAYVVEYDKELVIDCNMFGNPAPEFQWFKNGNPYTHGDQEGSLLKVRARAEDDGQFHCLATNRAGSTDNFVNVQVKGAPKGSAFAFWFIAFLVVIFAAVVMCLAWKLRVTKKITKQKDIALNNLYEHMMRNNAGPPPEDIKELPINERVYYLPYNTEYEILRENLEINERIGSGQFGVVCKGLLQMADPKSQIEYKTRLPVAVKMANNRYNIEQQKMLADELKVMCAIGKHPNVLALVGACTNNMRKGQLFLVTEFMEGGNLLSFLVNHRDTFVDELIDDDGEEDNALDDSYMVPNSVAKKKKYKDSGANGENDLLLNINDDTLCSSDLISFGMQIANGMEYLASIPCVHRDLACRNILLTKNKIIRVADFGLAKRHPNKSYYVTKSSTETPIPIRWMALESIQDMRYTHKSDVWSFAICLYEIFSLGGVPYPGVASMQITQHLTSGGRNAQPKYCHEDIYQLMKKCWSEKEQDRPTFSECVQFFKHHMSVKSKELLERVDDLLRIETEHQTKLDEWITNSRPDAPGLGFSKPVKKPLDERYFIVESHA